MTPAEFHSALTTDSWFTDPDELIAYRLPVVQYFISNYSHGMLMLNGQMIFARNVQVKYNPLTDFCLVNFAYESILKLFKEGKLK